MALGRAFSEVVKVPSRPRRDIGAGLPLQSLFRSD
jgi:hypothetical protein